MTFEGSPNCPLPKTASTVLQWNKDKAKHEVVRITAVEETLKLLEQIEGDIAVVSIVGPYRTGKSFLLNQLLPHAGQWNPFKVGDTVQPETEEVSMVVIPPCASKLPGGETLIFLDSPGLFAPNRAPIFDAQLLAVLNLLSSVVLYNNVGVIDRSAVEKLAYAITTASTMSYFEQESKENAISRPHLLWTIQNFNLLLNSGQGQGPATGAEWIQQLLSQIDHSNNGTSTFHHDFNAFFRSLGASFLPFPTALVDDLKRLTKLPVENHTPAYKKAVDDLSSRISHLSSAKTIGDMKLTGTRLAELVRKWAEGINVPINDFKANSAQELLEHILRREVARASLRYVQLMQEVRPPMLEKDLLAKHEEALALTTKGHSKSSKAHGNFVTVLRQGVSYIIDGMLQDNRHFVASGIRLLEEKVNASIASIFTLAVNASDTLAAVSEGEAQVLRALEEGARPSNLSLAEADPTAMREVKLRIEGGIDSWKARAFKAHALRLSKQELARCGELADLTTLAGIAAQPHAPAGSSPPEKPGGSSPAEKLEGSQPAAGPGAGNSSGGELDARGREKAEACFHKALAALQKSLGHADTERLASRGAIHGVQKQAEDELRLLAGVEEAARRHSAVLSFVGCIALLKLPVEAAAIGACEKEAQMLCRDAQGRVVCTIGGIVETHSAGVVAKNEVASREACRAVAERVMREIALRVQEWWMLDSTKTWKPLKTLHAEIDAQWGKGDCRGPGRELPDVVASAKTAADGIELINTLRSEVGWYVMAFMVAVTGKGTLITVYSRLFSSGVGRDDLSRSRQQFLMLTIALLEVLAMLVGVATGVFFPQGTARLDYSAEGFPTLSFQGSTSDIGLVHIFLLNVLLINLIVACESCFSSRRARLKAATDRYNV